MNEEIGSYHSPQCSLAYNVSSNKKVQATKTTEPKIKLRKKKLLHPNKINI